MELKWRICVVPLERCGITCSIQRYLRDNIHWMVHKAMAIFGTYGGCTSENLCWPFRLMSVDLEYRFSCNQVSSGSDISLNKLLSYRRLMGRFQTGIELWRGTSQWPDPLDGFDSTTPPHSWSLSQAKSCHHDQQRLQPLVLKPSWQNVTRSYHIYLKKV